MPVTTYEFIKGKLSWARVVDLNQFGDWSITIHPEPDSLERLRDMQAKGLKNVMKKDNNGYYMQFKCPPKKEKDGKVLRYFSAPVVVDKDNNPLDGRTIGNGSDGYLKLEVYNHKTPTGGYSIAARLVGVRIDNLVPFDPQRDNRMGDATSDGLAEQKDMLF
mgnify:CR=1 FL=1